VVSTGSGVVTTGSGVVVTTGLGVVSLGVVAAGVVVAGVVTAGFAGVVTSSLPPKQEATDSIIAMVITRARMRKTFWCFIMKTSIKNLERGSMAILYHNGGFLCGFS
jgi:hypothetical protein